VADGGLALAKCAEESREVIHAVIGLSDEELELRRDLQKGASMPTKLSRIKVDTADFLARSAESTHAINEPFSAIDPAAASRSAGLRDRTHFRCASIRSRIANLPSA
jgi:hypothetical protein